MRTTADVGLSGGGALVRAHAPALVVFAIRVASAGLAYGVQVFLARLMGQAEYGVFAVAWAATLILGHASLWGVGRSVCRFVPAYRARGEADLARGFLSAGLRFSLLSGLATALVGGVVLWLARDRLDPAYLAPLAVALCVVPVFALQDYAEGVARSFHWTTLAIAPPYLVRQFAIMAAMGGAVLLGAAADPATAVAAVLVGTVATIAVQGAFLLPRLRAVLPPGPRALRPAEWRSASLTMGLVDLAMLAFTFADVLVLGLLLPPEAVGGYFAATRVLQFVQFVSYATSAATAQRFAEAEGRGDRAGLAALVTRTARVSALATVASGTALLAAAPFLLASFGPSFQASVPVLAVLVLGVVAKSLCGPGEDVLTMLGAERACAAVSAASLVAAVVLMGALVPAFGILGAAVAMAAAMAGRGLVLAVAARRALGIDAHVFARSRP